MTTLPPDLPDDLPIVTRNAVRLIVLDKDGDVLLLRAREYTRPQLGIWWELPGGGIADGESPQSAASRELAEETGLHVNPEQIAATRWTRSAAYLLRDTRRVQTETVLRVQLTARRPACHGEGRLGYELDDYLGFRWTSPSTIEAAGHGSVPGSSPVACPNF